MSLKSNTSKSSETQTCHPMIARNPTTESAMMGGIAIEKELWMIGSAISMPTALEFTVLGRDAGDGVGTLIEDGTAVFLSTEFAFSTTTGVSSERTLRARINAVPALLVGHVDVRKGELSLRITEIRLGSDIIEPTYISVLALFEHAVGAAGYRHEDGAGRFPTEPLLAPSLGNARAMQLIFPDAHGRIELKSFEAAPIDEFEEHLAAFQDLLTFAADSPSGRLTLTATEAGGGSVKILGRSKFPPFGRSARRPIEHVIRLANSHAQSVIDMWWAARENLRPVPQILAGVKYQPGFVQSNVITLAAALEKYVKTVFPRPAAPTLSAEQIRPLRAALEALEGLDADQTAAVRRFVANRPVEATYRQHLQAFVSDLGVEVISAAKIHPEEWIDHLLWARNDIAHEGAPNNQSGERYVTDLESRAVRDATWVVLALGFAKQAGVPGQALLRAAERLGVRYGPRHAQTTIYA